MNQYVLSFDPTPRPICAYAALWDRDAKTLNAWCAKGWVPGAWKHPSGEWWVNPLDLLSFDHTSVGGEVVVRPRRKQPPGTSIKPLRFPGA